MALVETKEELATIRKHYMHLSTRRLSDKRTFLLYVWVSVGGEMGRDKMMEPLKHLRHSTRKPPIAEHMRWLIKSYSPY